MKHSKITTGRGDTGYTSLTTLERVHKTDRRILAVGKLDTFNAALGLCHEHLEPPTMKNIYVKACLVSIQEVLFKLMGEVAASDPVSYAKRFPQINAVDISNLDSIIRQLGEYLDNTKEPLKDWAVYGLKGPAAARFDYAGTLCRECELNLWNLTSEYFVRSELKVYLNRLSKVLYLIARYMEYEN